MTTIDTLVVPIDKQALDLAERIARGEWLRVAAEKNILEIQALQLFNVFWATVEMEDLTRIARDRRRPRRRK